MEAHQIVASIASYRIRASPQIAVVVGSNYTWGNFQYELQKP